MTDTMGTQDFLKVLEDIRGFGISDNEDVITIQVGKREVRLQVANISPEDEIFAMERATGLKGWAWVQRMRCEILARAVTRVNGVKIDDVEFAKDPDTGDERPTRSILADSFAKWGQEVCLVLWKIYMVHCQNLEDSLLGQLPDAQIMTEVEKRFMDRINEELVAISAQAITEAASEAASDSTGEGQEAPQE